MIPTLEALYLAVQKACLPGIWSKGIALTRDDSVLEDSSKSDEIRLRVVVKDKAVHPKVTLWPEDEDWFCDCGDRNEVCAHVAAAIITLKSGKRSSSSEASSSSRHTTTQIIYRLTRDAFENRLLFERVMVFKKKERVLNESLVAWVGGVTSGRIPGPPCAATQEDFAVDAIVGRDKRGELSAGTWLRLARPLSKCSNLFLDGAPVTLSSQPVGTIARVEDDGTGQGYRVRLVHDESVTETFRNGVALCGSLLRPWERPDLPAEDSKQLEGQGRVYPQSEAANLVTRVIPALKSRLPVDIVATGLPILKQVPPRIVLRLDPEPNHTLCVVAMIEYGYGTAANEIIVPDPAAEWSLARKVQAELHLRPGQPVRFQGQAAVEFRQKLVGWETAGSGSQQFTLNQVLVPRFSASEDGFSLDFDSAGGPGQGAGRADAQVVLNAWSGGAAMVPLLGGGYAPLPTNWLAKYGARILALMAAKTTHEKVPSYLVPELADLCQELEASCPEPWKKLRERLHDFSGIPEAPLPADLKAELRHYQQAGVNWLCFLRDNDMGALLADDMGLGKTLQALCAIRGRTLVVAPTSVLFAWKDQIERFRPTLSTSLYYGPGRKLDPKAEVTLTSYALLRLDRESLIKETWDTVVLDEAQTIKNPDSLVARVAHSLRAGFKMALSGTPVENRLDDLWSQFRFINPGLLGDRERFQTQYALPINRGDDGAAKRLRARIRPFLLRRLKKEVAPELPPRTEIVLHCELSAPEQEIYDSILAASRQEVMDALATGQGVFAALEMLLRLRQACCDPTLIPGQEGLPGAAASAKLELLLETLGNSVAQGHRALIFSQWTSLLDRVGPRLKEAGISFSRLDGSSPNRAQLVEQFQDPAGPQAMLISLKAGGVGLTLTAADHVFILDPWWNPAAEDQAADRAHRIGQTQPVLIHRLVARDTVEDRILELQKRKLGLAGAVLSDAGGALSLSRDDLIGLLN